MIIRIYKLYLIRTGDQPLALIAAKNAYEAIIKYTKRIGFDKIRTYFCSFLITNTVEIDTRMSNNCNIYSIIKSVTKTIDGGHLNIDSSEVTSCNSIFTRVDTKDINSPLFIRPTIKEVRNCYGFGNTSERELRKFCM